MNLPQLNPERWHGGQLVVFWVSLAFAIFLTGVLGAIAAEGGSDDIALLFFLMALAMFAAGIPFALWATWRWFGAKRR
jgi:hypothetical protein